jgi:hypothetical protein
MPAKAKPKTRKAKRAKPEIFPPLTAEERVRMVKNGFTEEDIARDPGLRYAGVIGDDPDFFKPMQEYYRESRGRELFND